MGLGLHGIGSQNIFTLWPKTMAINVAGGNKCGKVVTTIVCVSDFLFRLQKTYFIYTVQFIF